MTNARGSGNGDRVEKALLALLQRREFADAHYKEGMAAVEALSSEVERLGKIEEAARAVDSWWVMRSMRQGDPMDGETGEAKQQARALHVALAGSEAEEPAE